MSRLVVLFVLAAAMLFVFETATSAPTESTPSCPVNETWSACGNGCQNTCGLRNIHCLVVCNPRLSHGACRCAPGYLRGGKNGECILPQDCPNNP
ncbi:unnamed protein product [Xylocopa violacea]|uniref:TIL domain-containing protein n=1 Tax=Xylocopa violacea TaxID=135666 RepID=A0ABP1PAP4_XYLVO